MEIGMEVIKDGVLLTTFKVDNDNHEELLKTCMRMVYENYADTVGHKIEFRYIDLIEEQ